MLRRLWPILFLAIAAPAVEWPLDDPAEVDSARNLDGATTNGGIFYGVTTWDPYVYFTLPEGGLDAKDLTRLTVRLYSSAPADNLSIYYQTDDGRWGLGSALPLVAGLAEYRVDLTRVFFRESSPQEGSKQWAGTTGKLTKLRIDPGNQEGRWIAIDNLRLNKVDRAPFEPGSTPLSGPSATLTKAEAPAAVTAGEPIQVDVTMTGPARGGDDTLVVWLMGPAHVWTSQAMAVALQPGAQTFTVEFGSSKYDQPSDLTVQAGLLGRELAGGGYGQALGALKLSNPLAGTVQPPMSEIRPLGGDPAMFVDGQPMAPFMVSINGVRQHEQQAEMGWAGVHLYSDWFGGSTAADLGHLTPETYDYSYFDTYFAAALEADPEAYFLPHLGITPPLWWQDAHPEELCLYDDGTTGPQSFASEVWRRETGEDLRKLIAHLEAAPYADRIIGYIPFSGYSAEWQSWGLWLNHLADYSEPAKRAWQAWRLRRYGPDATVPPLPTPEQRHHGDWGALRDPVAERTVIDFYEFLADMTVDAIEYFCAVVKDVTGRRSLCGTYYGYLTQHGQRQQDSSHLGLSRLLKCQDLDFLMSPPLYTDRQFLGTANFMSAVGSVRLHGKLWLSEADYRTYLTPVSEGTGRTDTPSQTTAVLRREMANILTSRAAVSWYDMSGGWLGEPLPKELGQLNDLHRQSLTNRQPFTPEIGVVVDERSACYFTAMHPLYRTLVNSVIPTLPRVGASWEYVLLDDVVSGELSPHKLYLFLDAFRIDDGQRAMLRTRLNREQSTAIWFYAPGIYGDGQTGPAAVQALTGFPVTEQPWSKPLRMVDAAGAVIAGEETGAERIWVPASASGKVYGYLEGTDTPGLVSRAVDGWTSVYSVAPKLTPDLLREFARKAGCHIYTDCGGAFYTDDQWIGVQAPEAGPVSIALRQAGKVVDALTGQPVKVDGDEATLDMAAGETRLLRVE